MAASGSGLDMTKLDTADRIVLGASGLYVVWTFVPVWYTCCAADAASISGFRGVLIIPWLLSIAAIAEIVLTKLTSTRVDLPIARGMLHLGVAGVAALFVLVGLVARGTGLAVSWGYALGLLTAVAWAYGAYMMYVQPAEAASGRSGAAAPRPRPSDPVA